MSKAFTKEDAEDAPLLVPPRAPLPPGVSNYVTRRGLRLLREELVRLGSLRSEPSSDAELETRARSLQLAQRIQELEARLASAVLVVAGPESHPPQTQVRFGARVQLRLESGEERVYRIVGVDEADADAGFIAFSSPLARSLLGKETGDVVLLRTPRGAEELELQAISYDEDE